ncbi:MAG: neutral zinc metallopeptidase [Cyclobacteriaceae bacterium]|jgi:predicted metalloprotease|nr:zinc metallopeptidase [Flammeovirgaceae bacterium]
MKWTGRRQSSNVDDQRGSSGGGGGLPGGLLSKGGLGTIVVVLLISWLTGVNPLSLLQQTNIDSGPTQSVTLAPNPEEEELKSFVSVVLASTEDVWQAQLPGYRFPVLELFRGQTQSGCGSATSASGPFYCSADERVYIDLSFYEELKNQLNAPGDFAQAYVIAHEVGHHIQHLRGITDKVHAMRDKLSDEEYNKLSVKLELQADFLAGMWAHYAKDNRDFIEEGDIEEALNAAAAIGDDRLQKKFQGTVVPDSFTHGTSEQRVRWFLKGFKTGDMAQGDTFSTDNL